MMALAAIFTILTSCEDSANETSLSVNPTSLNFEKEGGTLALRILSDGNWSVSDIPSWITLSAVSGQGEADISVTAKANTSGVLREGVLLLRTGDTSNALSVNVKQTAGETGLIISEVQERVFNGATLSMDSVVINADVSWTVETPDWLRAAWKNLAIKTDGTAICQGSGTLMLLTEQNANYEDRNGTVVIRSKEDNTVFSIPVTQLGMYNVRPVDIITLANGFASLWKYGCEVSYILWEVFEGGASAAEKTFEKALKYTSFFDASPTMLSMRRNCKPNTLYEICALGLSDTYDSNMDVDDSKSPVNCLSVTTPSDVNVAKVDISDVNYDEGSGEWNFKFSKNPYVYGFYTRLMTDSIYEKYSDPYVAWNMLKRIKEDPSAFPLLTVDGSYYSSYQGDFLHIITWGVNANGQLSSIITRASGKKGSAEAPWRNAPSAWYGKTALTDDEQDNDCENVDLSKTKDLF